MANASKALRLVLVLVSALSIALVGGCAGQAGTDDGADGAAKVVKLGFAAPLTGDNAVYGEGMKRAVELAIEEFNAQDEAARGGLTFELRAEDDMADPKQAVNVANLLVGDTDVVGIVGHFNSGCSIPAAPVYEGAKLAMVTVSSNPALTATGLENVNRVVAKDDAQGTAAGALVADDLGLKKVVVVDDGTPYGQGLAAEFEKTFTSKGGTVVLKESVQSKDVDFAALISRAKQLAPEAWYFAGAYAQGGLLSKQSKEAGLKVPVIGGDMLYSPEYIKVAGAANAEGDIATALGLPLDQQPKGVEFARKYQQKFGKQPEAYDSYAYDAAWIVMNAAAKAGADRAAVMRAARTGSFDGVTGLVEFDESGDNKQQVISQYRVTGGEWRQMK